MRKIKIGDRYVGSQEKLYFIADIGANHDGKIDRAFKLIELAKEAGGDAVKFQNFQAHKIVSKKGFNSMTTQLSHQESWKKSVYEVYEDVSLSFDWTSKLKEKCLELEIEYLTSAYDFESIDHVFPYLNIYKIGSGDITWLEIIEYIAKKRKPVIMATGASTLEDVERAMATLLSYTQDIILMQCNTNYTGKKENFKYINLNVLDIYKSKFPDVILGLSDHTIGHATVLGAVAKGARVFEKHFTDDNSRTGPDHFFAMNPVTWREMVERANELNLALGDGIKRIEENEIETSKIQRRGLRYTRDLKIGHIITKDDIFPLRPINDDGIPPYQANQVIGKEIIINVSNDQNVKWEDLK